MFWDVWNDAWLAGCKVAASNSQVIAESLAGASVSANLPANNDKIHVGNIVCNYQLIGKISEINTENNIFSDLEESHYLSKLGNQAICTVNELGQLLYKSSNWADVTGLSSSDNGETDSHDNILLEFMHLANRKNFLDKIKFLTGEEKAADDIFTSKMRCQISSDEQAGYNWFEIVMMPRDDGVTNSNFANECILLIRNINHEIKLEKSLRLAQIESELAEKSRYDFLGHMSHELRTPLNAMLGFAEMMEQGVYGEIKCPEYNDYLGNIRESGNLLLGRINDMIEIVNVGIGDGSLNEESIAIGDLFEAAKKLYRHEAFGRNITVNIAISSPKITIYGDKAKLTRAIGNILSNSIRFSTANSNIDITYYINKNDELGDEIAIQIIDLGEGMSELHLNRIQDSLGQPDCLFSQNPDNVGVGLGLAVTKEFINLHDGALEIESKKNIGTTTTIFLPNERFAAVKKERNKVKIPA